MYIICRWPRCIGIRWGGTIGSHGLWSLDYFDVDTCPKGLKMGYNELLVCRRSGRRQKLCELSEAKGGQHSCEVSVMRKVEVEGLV